MPEFRFQTLLEYRSRQVEDRQIALAQAQRHLAEERARLEQWRTDRARFADQLKQSMQGSLRVDEVQHQYRYLEALDRVMAEQQRIVAEAEAETEAARAALETALKDRKTLEKLKEYDERAGQEALRQHEAETLDDFNIARYRGL